MKTAKSNWVYYFAVFALAAAVLFFTPFGYSVLQGLGVVDPQPSLNVTVISPASSYHADLVKENQNVARIDEDTKIIQKATSCVQKYGMDNCRVELMEADIAGRDATR